MGLGVDEWYSLKYRPRLVRQPDPCTHAGQDAPVRRLG
jgi:hypothetical protein